MANQEQTTPFSVYPQNYGSPPTYQQVPATAVEMNNIRAPINGSGVAAQPGDDLDQVGKSFVTSEKYLDLDFDACFYENKTSRTIPQVYRAYGIVFKSTNIIIYNILAIFLGVPLAILWGILFSMTSFFLTWIWNPSLKWFLLMFGVMVPAVTEPFKALYGPIVDVHARIFRQIKVKMTKIKPPAQTA